jgi:hypothetical protein
LFLVDFHPVTHVGSRRMCLDSNVVPSLAGFRLYAILGVFHYVLSVHSVCIFKIAHCSLVPASPYINLSIYPSTYLIIYPTFFIPILFYYCLRNGRGEKVRHLDEEG